MKTKLDFCSWDSLCLNMKHAPGVWVWILLYSIFHIVTLFNDCNKTEKVVNRGQTLLHHNRDQLKHIFSLLARQVARSEDTRYNHGIIKPQCSSTAQAQQHRHSSTGTTYNRHTARVWSPRKVGRIEFSDARMHIGQSRRWRFFKTKHRTFCLLQINPFTEQSILLIQISQFGDLA